MSTSRVCGLAQMDEAMKKAEGRTKYTVLRAVVSRILNETDPIGLLAMGAPGDEYDPEVSTVLPRLREVTSAGDVRAILHEEFVRWFDESIAGPPETYDLAATRIWEHLQKDRVT